MLAGELNFLNQRRYIMAWPQFIKNEPIAVIGLVVTLMVGALSSPILVNWYAGPELQAIIRYNMATDGRCFPKCVVVTNAGKSTATNVRIYFKFDYFHTRGDIKCYYSRNEPYFNIEKNVDYKLEGKYVLIPGLPPGVSQEFVYIEEGISETRESRITERDPAVFDFPQIERITSSQGGATSDDQQDCEKRS